MKKKLDVKPKTSIRASKSETWSFEGNFATNTPSTITTSQEVPVHFCPTCGKKLNGKKNKR